MFKEYRSQLYGKFDCGTFTVSLNSLILCSVALLISSLIVILLLYPTKLRFNVLNEFSQLINIYYLMLQRLLEHIDQRQDHWNQSVSKFSLPFNSCIPQADHLISSILSVKWE